MQVKVLQISSKENMEASGRSFSNMSVKCPVDKIQYRFFHCLV